LVASRSYQLGKRRASVGHTREAILQAARNEVAAGTEVSLGRVAERAGVSRITVYNQFGSKAELLQALRPSARPEEPSSDADARDQLRQQISVACSIWASNAALLRHLPRGEQEEGSELNRRLAQRLAAADALRPGCSIKEAEDVIGALTSFDLFDRLYRDGRRSPGAVAEILMRLASGILI
jgi:hypothetical protein